MEMNNKTTKKNNSQKKKKILGNSNNKNEEKSKTLKDTYIILPVTLLAEHQSIHSLRTYCDIYCAHPYIVEEHWRITLYQSAHMHIKLYLYVLTSSQSSPITQPAYIHFSIQFIFKEHATRSEAAVTSIVSRILTVPRAYGSGTASRPKWIRPIQHMDDDDNEKKKK